MRRATIALAITALALTIAAYQFSRRYCANASTTISLPAPDLRPPPPPVTTYISCEALGNSLRVVGGDATAQLEIAPRCAPDSFYFEMLIAPVDFANVETSPKVAFEIGRDGAVTNVSTLTSSGNRNVDEKAIQLVRSRRYETGRCGKCRVQTTINVDVQRNVP